MLNIEVKEFAPYYFPFHVMLVTANDQKKFIESFNRGIPRAMKRMAKQFVKRYPEWRKSQRSLTRWMIAAAYSAIDTQGMKNSPNARVIVYAGMAGLATGLGRAVKGRLEAEQELLKVVGDVIAFLMTYRPRKVKRTAYEDALEEHLKPFLDTRPHLRVAS